MSAKSGSQRDFDWKLEKNILIPMRDGTSLAGDAYVPVAKGQFPAIIGYYGPYHKDLITGGSGGSHFYDFGVYFAKRGYRVFFVDVRGTGNSEGMTDRLYSEQEQRDSYEVVEWLARQPWCNGNVGMYGVSYGFYSTVLCAAMNPPHLKAIVPFSGGVDWYSAGWAYEGGNACASYYLGSYAAWMIGMNFMPPEYHDPDGRWVKVWQDHVEKNVPWFLASMKYDVDGPYYRVASVARKYKRIKTPALVLNGWHDYYPSWPITFFRNIKVPKKLIAGPWLHEFPDRARPAPRIDILREIHRWFDYWLKGKKNGVLDEPSVALYVQEYTRPDELRHPTSSNQRGRWRFEDDFPPLGTSWKSLYLSSDGVLSWEIPRTRHQEDVYDYNPSAGIALGLAGGSGGPVGMPIDQRYEEPLALTYSTAPLSAGVEVTGQPRLVLHVSSSTDIATFVGKLCDESPDGTTVLVSRWSMNAAHRHSSSNPKFLRPNKKYELDFDLWATSYLFRRGHRIKLYVASADFPWIWPTPKAAVNTIHLGSLYPSRVELPIVPRRKKPNAPSFLPPPSVSSLAEEIEPSYWRVIRDMGKNVASVEWGHASRYKTEMRSTVEEEHRCVQTVNTTSPAHSKVDSSVRFILRKPSVTVETRAKLLIESDGSDFHVMANVDIKNNGADYFHKEWKKVYPRRFR